MRFFRKSVHAAEMTGMTRTVPLDSSHRGRHREPDAVQASTKEARERISTKAAAARAEIESLVATERAQLQIAIDQAVGDAEERLRGATERRIDIEMKQQLDEAETKLRRDLKRIVRAEVAKAAKKKPRTETSGNDSVPIRARA